MLDWGLGLLVLVCECGVWVGFDGLFVVGVINLLFDCGLLCWVCILVVVSS